MIPTILPIKHGKFQLIDNRNTQITREIIGEGSKIKFEVMRPVLDSIGREDVKLCYGMPADIMRENGCDPDLPILNFSAFYRDHHIGVITVYNIRVASDEDGNMDIAGMLFPGIRLVPGVPQHETWRGFMSLLLEEDLQTNGVGVDFRGFIYPTEIHHNWNDWPGERIVWDIAERGHSLLMDDVDRPIMIERKIRVGDDRRKKKAQDVFRHVREKGWQKKSISVT